MAQGYLIMRDGSQLDADGQSRALQAQAAAFNTERLPVLRALGVA